MEGQKNYFGKGNIRPSLPGVKSPDNPADPNLSAKHSLKDAENSAKNQSTKQSSEASNLSSLRSAEYESHTRSLYAGTGKKTRHGFSGFKGLLTKITLAKLAPVAVAVVLIGAIAVIFGSQSFLGPHIEALFTEATNSDYTAYNLRANEIMTEILAGKIEMPDYLKKRLEKEGITVVNNTTLEYDGTTITADNFITMYNSDVNFREAVTYARRGRVATFFDSAATTFYKKLGLSRDVLHSYDVSGDQDADKAEYDGIMTNYFKTDGNTSAVNTAEEHIFEDDQGNKQREILKNGENISSGGASAESPEERARAYLDSVGEKVWAETPGCAALQIGNIVATAIASNSRYIPAHQYMTTMESISKAKYGSSDATAINTVLNWFTKPQESTVYDARTGEKLTMTGSPLESQGMRTVLGGLTANRTDTRRYSIERSFESTNVSMANNGLVADVCSVERAAGVVLSLAALAIPGSNLVRTTVGILLGVGIGEGIQIVASSVLSLLIPTIAEVMYTNPYPGAVGIAGGELFSMGAANINMLAAQQNSGSSGASRAEVMAYNVANNVTIAQQAEIDRKNHSPFDATNKNTFLGSITKSLLPLATTTSSLTSSVSTISSITRTSLASLNPTYAAGEDTSYLTSFGDYCDKTSEVGASANMYCAMIAVSDLSTINIPEDDAKYREVISESVEVINGREVVKDDSPLADYITFWMGRYSMPGIYDANIAYACKHRLTSIPILSDIVAMIESLDDEYCRSVADGSRYINSESNPYWETEKYHQLWVLSARVKENLGLYSAENNPIAVYRAHYDELHPLDNSRSGYLARISGLSKEEAQIALDLIDYYQEIASYDPSTRFQFANLEPQKLAISSDRTNYYILDKQYSTTIKREGQLA